MVAHRNPKAAQVAALWNEGKKPKEIAAELGMPYSTAWSAIKTAIMRGEAEYRPRKPEPLNVEALYRRKQMPVGHLGPEMNAMSQEVLKYWADEAIGGRYSSLAEMAADIMVDEYYRRQEAKK